MRGSRKRSRGPQDVTLLRVLLLGIAGPVLALIVTWQSAVRVASVQAGSDPTAEIVEKLRTAPDDSVLKEMREFAVSYPRFYQMPPDRVLEMADKSMRGKYVPPGRDVRIGVPFQPGEYLFGRSTWHLAFHSFWIPSLLGQAYEISGQEEYIEAAVQYILDWASYESDLLVPRGYFFNDHALAARSIVVTEVWRLYRQSKAYHLRQATALLGYVQKLSRLLLEDRLFQYRSNHGIMQSLSLLHLGIAFPVLDVSESSIRVGKRRLMSQLEYYVNSEGVILEHSPGYHRNGLGRLAAVARYFGLLGEPVSDDFATRYRKALDFLAALRRPDGTLPPIGDTDDRPLSAIQVVSLDHHVALEPLRDQPAELPAPPATTAAPGAGWIILWDGLSSWPEASGLTQTVLHWGNFPTAVHKHADDMAISLWSHGSQWVRSVGLWPYVASRNDATGWRSSNGPHWLDESPASARVSGAVGSVLDDQLAFFEILRTNADGSDIRRQLLKLGSDLWIVLDSFESSGPRVAEVVWRFPPGVAVQESNPNCIMLESAGTNRNMSVEVDGSDSVDIDADSSGSAAWNSGMVVGGEITSSPAIRLTSSTPDPVIATILRFQSPAESAGTCGTAEVSWESAVLWQVSLDSTQDGRSVVKREHDSVEWALGEGMHTRKNISTSLAESSTAPKAAALAALKRARSEYGTPFQPMTERRLKVTFAVAAAAIGQLFVFFLFYRRRRKGWPPLAIGTSIAWLGLSLYLGLIYLV
jgi:hypothetical protein